MDLKSSAWCSVKPEQTYQECISAYEKRIKTIMKYEHSGIFSIISLLSYTAMVAFSPLAYPGITGSVWRLVTWVLPGRLRLPWQNVLMRFSDHVLSYLWWQYVLLHQASHRSCWNPRSVPTQRRITGLPTSSGNSSRSSWTVDSWPKRWSDACCLSARYCSCCCLPEYRWFSGWHSEGSFADIPGHLLLKGACSILQGSKNLLQ